MIGLSTITFDLDGALIIDTDRNEDVRNIKAERRISRTATLDGSVLIADMGYTDGDRTITVVENKTSQATIAFIQYIFQYYSLIVATTDDGAYEVAPERYSVDNGKLTASFLVSSKLS